MLEPFQDASEDGYQTQIIYQGVYFSVSSYITG